MYVVQQVPSPAPNSNWSFTVPAQSLYRLISVYEVVTYTAGASAAIALQVSDGMFSYGYSANIVGAAGAGSNATQWVNLNGATAGGTPTQFVNSRPIPNLILPGGYTISTRFTVPIIGTVRQVQIAIWADDLNTTPEDSLIGSAAAA